MKRIIMFLLIVVLIPATAFAEATKKIVERYPSLSPGGTELPGSPKTVVYLNDKGEEIAREIYKKDGTVIETIGKIPDGVVKEYFDNGALLAEYNYQGGVLEGKSKGYYSNGAFRGEWNYKNGKLEGKMKYFYENGNLNYETNYKNDKKNGISKHYHGNGKLLYEFNFKEDKFDGVTKGYYESGKLNKEYNYKAGKREGISKDYYESGKLQLIENYNNGQKINREEYDQKGNLISGKDHSDHTPHPVKEKKGE